MVTTYTPTIGLEIHAELKTKTKMFCSCRNAPHEQSPNTHICPICMGHPGTLPAVNAVAVRHALLVGRALGGTLATYSAFDRKNYFYPDIPKGYQISQYAHPLVLGGRLSDVAITRVHLEEDTARSLHDKTEGALIDFNRAGVPLLELVTEPVMHDAKTAGNFARELQLLLRALGVSDANMERGEMRVEVNISVSASNVLGTKVEVKNINSFKSVEAAIAYEVERQVACIEGVGKVVQETRGWDEAGNVSVSQRKKESSHDYRYFPDPDIPKFNISEIPELALSRLDEIMPEKPSDKRIKFSALGLTSNVVEILASHLDISAFFMSSLAELEALKPNLIDKDRQKLANYVISDLLGYVAQHEDVSFAVASPKSFAKLIFMLSGGTINSRVAKDILAEVVFTHADPESLAHERGLSQQDQEADLLPLIDAVLKEHAGSVLAYKAGKTAVLQFLLGQCMKAREGTANPVVLKKLLIQRIASIS